MGGGVPGETTVSVHGPVAREFLSQRGTVIIHGTLDGDDRNKIHSVT